MDGYDRSKQLAKMDVKQLRELITDIFNEVYIEGPETEWNPDTIDAVARRLADAGLGPPLWCETNTDEARERIAQAFEASDEFAIHSDDDGAPLDDFEVVFEHGQWFVNVPVPHNDDAPRSYSVSDASGKTDFHFEAL
jgi:hypothetical protein